jgi:hypothetical protein
MILGINIKSIKTYLYYPLPSPPKKKTKKDVYEPLGRKKDQNAALPGRPPPALGNLFERFRAKAPAAPFLKWPLRFFSTRILQMILMIQTQETFFRVQITKMKTMRMLSFSRSSKRKRTNRAPRPGSLTVFFFLLCFALGYLSLSFVRFRMVEKHITTFSNKSLSSGLVGRDLEIYTLSQSRRRDVEGWENGRPDFHM